MGNRAVDIRYEAPRSMAEAETRRCALILDIQVIQAQLGDRARSRSMGDDDYNEWRRKTVFALTAKGEELRRVKGWIADHRPKGPANSEEHRKHLFSFLDYVQVLEKENRELKEIVVKHGLLDDTVTSLAATR